jgi:DNA-directed RNA polymerase subunit N (RpoN/RPB10)
LEIGMRRTRSGRRRSVVAGLLAVASLLAGSAVVAAISPAPAQAASSIGGKITRAEIIQRATNWYSRRNDSDLAYNQNLYTWDGTKSRKYRRDCSGYVDMSWHLSKDPNTGGLAGSDFTTGIGRADLLPGDLLDDTVDHESGYPYHAILFGGWENSAKTTFWYYSFGSTPLAKVTGASFSQSILSGHPTGDYTPLRYKNVVESSDPRDGDSVTGDAFTDLLALTPDGTMTLYSNNILIDDGIPYARHREIGHGWNGFDRLIPADVTGDGYTDLLALTPDGTMTLYSNNFVADDGIPYGVHREIGHGWNAYDRIIAADVTGDGFTDLVALTPAGEMSLYANNFRANNATPYSTHSPIGHGWNSFNRIMAADVTGDGYTDLLGITPEGEMSLYTNNFRANNAAPYSAHNPIGHGWNSYDRIIAADATGDGFTDLLGINPAGEMSLYPNNFRASNATPYSAHRDDISHGWNSFDRIV